MIIEISFYLYVHEERLGFEIIETTERSKYNCIIF